MSKISGSICDFNENLPLHAARFTVEAADKDGGHVKSKDSCEAHLMDMIRPLANSGAIPNIQIRRLLESDLEVALEIAVEQAKAPKRKSSSSGERIPCEFCPGKDFANNASLAAHKRQFHAESEGHGDHECPHCNRKSPTPQGLAAHIRARHPGARERIKVSV